VEDQGGCLTALVALVAFVKDAGSEMSIHIEGCICWQGCWSCLCFLLVEVSAHRSPDFSWSKGDIAQWKPMNFKP
jgi:hypothetical protein